uniref:Uncharacterized protein n=1 Tax=Onchocerca volvulus TaxID=6282 RepID=A0A8R1TN62_ONCVO
MLGAIYFQVLPRLKVTDYDDIVYATSFQINHTAFERQNLYSEADENDKPLLAILLTPSVIAAYILFVTL